MLVIRPEQMRVLHHHVARRYHGQTAAFLRAEAPEVFADADEREVAAFVAHGLRRAGEHGITDSHYARQYLLFMAWVGPNFDVEHPWARAILGDDELSQAHKVNQLEGYIFTQWEGSAP